MVDDDRRSIPPERRQIPKQLTRIPIRRSHRSPRKLRQRTDPVVRRLHHHLVVHPIRRIQPLVRSRLPRTAQRNQHALRHILLRQPKLPRLTPVHVHLHRRIRNLLMHMNIHRPWNRRNLLRDLRRQLIVSLVPPHHLHVDRRGQTKVQNLVRDICRGKEERRIRELPRKILPQQPHVLRRLPLARLSAQSESPHPSSRSFPSSQTPG